MGKGKKQEGPSKKELLARIEMLTPKPADFGADWDKVFGSMKSWSSLADAKSGTSNFPDRESYSVKVDWNKSDAAATWQAELEKFRTWAIDNHWSPPAKAGRPALRALEDTRKRTVKLDSGEFEVVEQWGVAITNGWTIGVSNDGKLGMKVYKEGDRVAFVTWKPVEETTNTSTTTTTRKPANKPAKPKNEPKLP